MADQNEKPLIIADSSPLIAFAFPELTSVGKNVLLPETVAHECTRNLALPGAKIIHQALSTNILHRVPDQDLTKKPDLYSISRLIDPGEAQATALAQAQCGLLLIYKVTDSELVASLSYCTPPFCIPQEIAVKFTADRRRAKNCRRRSS